MAFRIYVYECDTPEELEHLRGVIAQRKEARTRSSGGIFRESDLEAVKALRDSPNGLKTDALARELRIPNASLPPTLNGWARRAGARGFSLDDLIERHRVNDSDGRPVTIYKLTPKGREVLAEQLSATESLDQE